MMKPAAPSQCFSAPWVPFQSSCTEVRRPHIFRALSCLVLYSLWSQSKTLNEKTGNCALILYKTNGKRAVLNAYYAPFPLST